MDIVSDAALMAYMSEAAGRMITGGGWLCLHVVGITPHLSSGTNPVNSSS